MYLLGLKTCDTTQKARKWLDEKDVEYTFADLREDPLNLDEVKELIFKVGADVLLNKRSRTWRALDPDAVADLDDTKIAQLLVEQPTLIKRPLLIKDEAVLVGFDPDSYQAFLEEESAD